MIIRTPNGNIVHMGDWRFENDPVDTQFDMPRLAEVAQKEGIDLLMNESTNIDTPGTHPHSEYAIGESVGEVMNAYPHARLIFFVFFKPNLPPTADPRRSRKTQPKSSVCWFFND
jgi:ribonuclease J